MASNSICTSCLRAASRSPCIKRTTFPRLQRSLPFSTTHAQRKQDPTPAPPPPPLPHIPKSQHDAITSFASTLRQSSALKAATEPYIAYGSTEDLFRECSRQCEYTVPARLASTPEEPPRTAAGEDLGEGQGWWYAAKSSGGLGLDATFNAWAQIMFLHMYVLTVRLRCFPAEHARVWHQQLVDHFFYAAEDRMVQWHAITMRGSRNKYLKDLWQQWRGVILSYDEGLVRGDAVLAAAVWRNVFKGEVEADVRDVALVTAYLRAQLKMLDELGDERIASGEVRFGDPNAVRKVVEQESVGMKRAFTAEELKAAQEGKNEGKEQK
ncbi:ubiquinol-cytochrome C chaperone-domain-containing protein [Neohortaea acidophila]|uniref:Ubiquinol-cytochrome C chaperone-domain-containing protein n=1 Tax=Neohortaea acidophila TaxID=245834 RepID=A0A6A6PMR4_9PEZI|nr:ubiquinol-cytochrome C chaperone-domain-containing protein [Neohortaea acidophila]KAF2481349.1 ubiquinol-cytochrome C chaperone-domain-containing protein [Neohortaea acidophila]